MTVRRIINNKGSRVPFIAPQMLISDVLEKLEFEDVGALVVSRNGKEIDGIISERDIVRGLRYFGAEILAYRVSDLMTENVITCQMTDAVIQVIALMDNNSVRHVPVLENDKLAGIISVRDIVKDRLNEVELDADAMQKYIAGTS